MEPRELANAALYHIRQGYERWLEQSGRPDNTESRRIFAEKMLQFLEALYTSGGTDAL